jgi:aspartate kinase
VGGPGIAGVANVLERTFETTTAVRANVLLISQSSSQNDVCLVVPSSVAERTVEALRREFANDLNHNDSAHSDSAHKDSTHKDTQRITLDSSVAMVTVVGRHMPLSGILGRTFAALSCRNINIVAVAHGSSECNISFVVSKQDVKAALNAVHQEFDLGVPHSRTISAESVAVSPVAWQYDPAQRTANAD